VLSLVRFRRGSGGRFGWSNAPTATPARAHRAGRRSHFRRHSARAQEMGRPNVAHVPDGPPSSGWWMPPSGQSASRGRPRASLARIPSRANKVATLST
jgi:hypothetical protein